MKVMFFSYRKLSYLILTSFFIVMITMLFYSTTRLPTKDTSSIFVMSNTIKTYKSLHIDTNGNGKKDTVNITVDEDKKEYTIQITNDDNKKYILTPDPKLKTIGPYIPWWPLQVTIADINGDKVPEIITQLSKTTHSIPTHIFRWDGKEYTRILSGAYEGISLIDVNGDMVPEVVTEERILGTGYQYSVYSWVVKSYNKINYKLDSSTGGYDKIQALMKCIGSPFEEKLSLKESLNEYFTEQWIKDIKNIEYINNFSKNIVGIQLQDYIGQEVKKEEKGSPKIIRWRLRYIVFRKFDSEIKAENYIAEIDTEQIGSSNQSYKIKNIKFKGQ